MSICKLVNGGDRSLQRLLGLHEYTFDDLKTEKGKLTGGYAGGASVEAMQIVNRLHHKESGRQFMQLVVAPTCSSSIELPKYLEFARYVGMLFPTHQSFYAVHTDTRHLHIHAVFNTVDFRTGRKLSIAPSDLNGIRRKLNMMLDDFGFDPIMEGTSCAFDSRDLLNIPGYARYELDESLLPSYSEAHAIDIWEDPVDIKKPYDPDYPYFLTGNIFEDSSWGGNNMNKFNGFSPSPLFPPQYPDTTDPWSQGNSGMVDTTSAIPTMTLDLGPKLEVTAEQGSDLTGIIPIMQSAFEEARNLHETAVNADYAMSKKAHDQGLPLNVHVDASPYIHINLVGAASDADYIDVEPDEDKDD